VLDDIPQQNAGRSFYKLTIIIIIIIIIIRSTIAELMKTQCSFKSSKWQIKVFNSVELMFFFVQL